MKVYFIRHGQTQYNKDGFLTGHTDVPLNEEGVQEAHAACFEIPEGISEIYSSDLIRCKQTTEILNQKLKTLVTYDSRLRERHFGSLQGKSWEDEDMVELREKDKNQEYDYRPYGGESVDDVKDRLSEFISDLKKSNKEAKILVVTSGGVLRLFYNLLKGEVHRKISNASFHEFDFSDIE